MDEKKLNINTNQPYSQQFYQKPNNTANDTGKGESNQGAKAEPIVSLPKGGGAIKGIGEKFQANPLTGTGSLTIPLPLSPGRNGFTPQLALSYDSGSGNGVYGLGWNIGLPSIIRKTDKGLPLYQDEIESDTFILSGAEDLVPELVLIDNNWIRKTSENTTHKIYYYRPRTEGLFAKIERWVNKTDGITHWRATTKDNITTVYGLSENSRISNPDDSKKTFQWLIERTADNKGSLIEYEYKQEDVGNITPSIYEQKRIDENKFPNRYLKKVRYGNTRTSNNLEYNSGASWLFHMVLDYGEHTSNPPTFTENTHWSYRTDPFSANRAGFEIRTYRLCQRILMFHQFSGINSGNPFLVRSLELTFDQRPELTLLTGVTIKGYDANNNQSTYPPVNFTYSQAGVPTKVNTLQDKDIAYWAGNTQNSGLQWFDLNNEGISGLLIQNPQSWYYKQNLGDTRYYDYTVQQPQLEMGVMQTVKNKPSINNAPNAAVQIGDLDGNGLNDVKIMAQGLSGYSEMDINGNFQPFIPFKNHPNINLNDPNAKMIDLNGDGLADVLITEHECFTIYYSEAKNGFKPAIKINKAKDEEKGPAIVFADGTQSIYLADMSGDGMPDIVRIRNGSIDYWPNLGYGKFGAKVSMKDAPHYDNEGNFNQNRIRLADVDGTGTTDIIYLGQKVYYWKNYAGNAWSQAIEILFPSYDSLSAVSVVDLFGNGTSCLLYTGGDTGINADNIKYVELTGGIKPFLLTEMNNNMGAHTKLQYAPSTKFYLRDKRQGKPWITRLPFPVHVLERVETWDEVTNNRYVNRYAYHHGYFDGSEREFRGFGMVEQWDTELYDQYPEGNLFTLGDNEQDETSNTPPVYTKTWYHTGFFTEEGKISTQYQNEYFSGDTNAWLLPDTQLPAGLTTKEVREACRVMKGSILRQEVYGQDGSNVSNIPYTVAEKTYSIKKIQPFGENRHAVFQVLESETITYNYERNATDPRIAHQLVVETDDFGNVTKAVTAAYPRRGSVPANQAQQQTFYVKYDENDFINQNTATDCYRIGLPKEQKSWQLFGLNSSNRLTIAAINTFLSSAEEIAYYDSYTSGNRKKKMTHTKNYYYNSGLTTVLSFGSAAWHGLPYYTQSLALTYAMLEKMHDLNTYNGSSHYNSLQPDAATLETLINSKSYIEDANTYWIRSARVYFDADNYYLPIRQYDAFENCTLITYDTYKLLPVTITDPLNDATQVTNNYYLLKPAQITDLNGNMQSVRYDALGMVIAFAVSGSGDTGDSLDNPTIRYAYELFAWLNNEEPVWVNVSAKNNHNDSNTASSHANCLQSYTYSNGLGQELQTKVQAENGAAWHLVNGEPVKQDNCTDRWVATGRTIYNNKQKVIKQYEPWFSTTFQYEGEAELTEYGVTPVMHYDTAGRLIRTDFPDGTFAKTTFDAWQQTIYDQNDTVLDSQWYEDRNPNSSATDEEKRAASLASAHDNTPQVIYTDSLGRPFLTIDNNGGTTRYAVLNQLNIAGNVLTVTDAKDRQMTTNYYDMTGQLIYSYNIDSGRRWMLHDITGKPLRLWDNRNNELQYEYDVLQRPTKTKLKDNGGMSVLTVESIVYGTSATNNRKGKPEYIYDQSGITHYTQFDFKGNPLAFTKQFLLAYNLTINWDSSLPPTMETAIYSAAFTYDAMNRPLTQTKPDSTIEAYTYNKAGLLETISARIRGASTWTSFITNINYNEKGQRTDIFYYNGSKTAYTYDSDTFRLKRLLTTRNTGNDILQDLNYTYDPVGNIVQQTDDAAQTFYFSNSVVAPTGKYEYDPLYRITHAEGRELTNLSMASYSDFINTLGLPPNSTTMQNYTQLYTYDELGNITQMSSQSHWTRNYYYPSGNNQLIGHTQNQTDYTYDAHGNILSMPHLSTIEWDYANRMRKSICGSTTTYYLYDYSGQRTRKINEKTGNIKEYRNYLGGYEVYRKTTSGTLNTERQTIHVDDGTKQFLHIETLTVDKDKTLGSPTPVLRYQYDNHLGSACLELSSTAAIISYEEYHPFGTTSYRSGVSEAEVSLKRYKYVGKERDEETGLYYYGARYYAAWLCRFVSVDPLQHKYPELTPYQYASNRPITMIDIDGLEVGDPSLKVTDMSNIASMGLNKSGSTGNIKYNPNYLEGFNFGGINSSNDKTSVKTQKLDDLNKKTAPPYYTPITPSNESYLSASTRDTYNPDFLADNNSYWEFKNKEAQFKNAGQDLYPVSFGGQGIGLGMNDCLAEGLKQAPMLIITELGIVKLGQFYKASKLLNTAKTEVSVVENVATDAKLSTRFITTPEGVTTDLEPTLNRITSGEKFPHRNDGSIFQNLPPKGKTESLLPTKPQGYYNEFVHPTPGIKGPGAMRIVKGKDGEMWFTLDHYKTFIPIK